MQLLKAVLILLSIFSNTNNVFLQSKIYSWILHLKLEGSFGKHGSKSWGEKNKPVKHLQKKFLLQSFVGSKRHPQRDSCGLWLEQSLVLVLLGFAFIHALKTFTFHFSLPLSLCLCGFSLSLSLSHTHTHTHTHTLIHELRRVFGVYKQTLCTRLSDGTSQRLPQAIILIQFICIQFQIQQTWYQFLSLPQIRSSKWDNGF